jgi:hypothetical protein
MTGIALGNFHYKGKTAVNASGNDKYASKSLHTEKGLFLNYCSMTYLIGQFVF